MTVEQIRGRLRQLQGIPPAEVEEDIGHTGAIEAAAVEGNPELVRIYDTQESGTYGRERAAELLSGLDDEGDGTERGAWEAIWETLWGEEVEPAADD
jgi:hypothetical protein